MTLFFIPYFGGSRWSYQKRQTASLFHVDSLTWNSHKNKNLNLVATNTQKEKSNKFISNFGEVFECMSFCFLPSIPQHRKFSSPFPLIFNITVLSAFQGFSWKTFFFVNILKPPLAFKSFIFSTQLFMICRFAHTPINFYLHIQDTPAKQTSLCRLGMNLKLITKPQGKNRHNYMNLTGQMTFYILINFINNFNNVLCLFFRLCHKLRILRHARLLGEQFPPSTLCPHCHWKHVVLYQPLLLFQVRGFV